MELRLAQSLAGHDKKQVYIIIEETDDSYLLVNGETKPLAKPKRKKKIHVQLIKNLPQEVKEIVGEINELDDCSSKKILKVYNRRNV